MFTRKKTYDKAAVTASRDIQDSSQSIRGLSNLYSPDCTTKRHIRDVADVLVEMGKLTSQQLEQLRGEERKYGKADAEQLLHRLQLATATDILTARAKLAGYEFRHIEPEQIDRQVFGKLELSYIKTGRMLPVAVENGEVIVATSRPTNIFAIDEVKRLLKTAVRIVVCSDEDIDKICTAMDQSTNECDLDGLISDMAEVEVVQESKEDVADLEKMAGESPVIKFVNYLISNAIHEGASDIHIEPKEKYTKVRYRIDGVLFDAMQPPAKMHSAVVSRIKIMSNLDISERRLPQDGKIAVIVAGRDIDLRVSTLPLTHGEKVVIRILDRKSISRGLDESGMHAETLKEFKSQIALPHGILLVTGPTGSGKSTTLYSALGQMDGHKLNISTVEDPVEYQLDFCNQVQVNDRIDMSFSAALRSLLRQDPDIIMIGEIRDAETSRIAVQAALTGHLVLSTLHTNDAPSSVTRLINIGVDPYLVAASLNAVLAQRLVRKICSKCKQSYKVNDNMRGYVEKIGIDASQLMHGTGCDSCRGSGYSGRLGIYELMIADEAIRDMINKDASVTGMRRIFRESGRKNLFEDGMDKVKQGITTIEEVLRVTEAYAKNENKIDCADVAAAK